MQRFSTILKHQPRLYLALRSLHYRLQGWPEAEIGLLPFLADKRRLSLDVGAHVGLYTCELLKHSSGVTAFEPNPASALLLERLCPGARVISAAASSQVGMADLRIPGDDHGRATIAPENRLPGINIAQKAVSTVKLDELLEEPVGFIKIDVEGHELQVLHGARGILARDRPSLIIEAEERHRPGAVASVCEFLADFGYVALVLDGFRLRAFAPSEKHSYGLGPINNFIFVN